jgi:hypothetical protein
MLAATKLAISAAAGQPNVEIDTAAAVNACVAPELQSRPLEQVSLVERQDMIACVNAHAARQLQASLPMQVDDITTLTELTTVGPLVVYQYRIARAARTLGANVGAQMESQTRAFVCADAQMRQTIALGGSYEYRWDDDAGQPIHKMRVTSC